MAGTSVETSVTTSSSALVERIRNQWAVVQAQWVAMPATLKTAWEQVGERVRTAFDLPTKKELAVLSARLDDLDAKLAILAAARGGATDEAHPPAPEHSRITADKRSRKKS